MRTLKYFLFFFIFLTVGAFGQQESSARLFERLQAISENNIDYYNIDGITISSQVINIPFSKENICKGLSSLKESVLSKSVIFLSQKNFVYEKIDTLCNKFLQYNTNYFIENEKGHITHIIYMSIDKQCAELQKTLTPLIVEKKIPETVFNKEFFNTLNFAGRKIDLGTYACRWTNVNCVQCNYRGEMNWSVHRDSLDAVKSVEQQRYITANCNFKKGDAKAVIENEINIIFEGQPLKASRITYQLEGEIGKLLLNTGGGNTRSLIIYYVVAPVRNNYVSCVMSHWNNDFLEEESGLPLLLGKVMQLKNK